MPMKVFISEGTTVVRAWGNTILPWVCQKVMPKVAEVAQGERCLLGAVTEDDYRTLTAAAQAYGHKLIALSPCDINKAKQINILVTDMGYPLNDIVIYPSCASLGYGMEYIYSKFQSKGCCLIDSKASEVKSRIHRT